MMAIMLACASPELEILGITTVAGNQTGQKTFANALSVLTLIGRTDIPVARGADKPLFRELTIAPTIHGKSGLDGAELPKPGMKARACHGVDLLLELLHAAREPVTLVPTGPLTNIALLLIREPAISKKIERIVLMGGAVNDSNITPAAEFYIYVDPEAADIVFSSGIPITMIGLDVTNKALVTFADIEKLGKAPGAITRVVAPLLRFFAEANRDIFGFAGAPVHDALAVASIIDPAVVRTKKLHVAVETKGELTRGRTVVDVYGVTRKKPNADVALELDSRRFVSMLFKALEILDRRLTTAG
jgi:inosine-uridine nucleoside N-ribohydrolase